MKTYKIASSTVAAHLFLNLGVEGLSGVLKTQDVAPWSCYSFQLLPDQLLIKFGRATATLDIKARIHCHCIETDALAHRHCHETEAQNFVTASLKPRLRFTVTALRPRLRSTIAATLVTERAY